MNQTLANAQVEHENHIVETLQQLIVAFVLAMTFRGFVAEGFVIPTGSMAPTLMGQHLRSRSPFTGASFAVGLDADGRAPANWRALLVDPMLGPGYEGTGVPAYNLAPRMGDRIFVVKSLYPFSEPNRFDVVVFKNPTEPTGAAENYIKRLIGLPHETVWLADGDVFTRREGEEDFKIRRKPEHVQRAVWQPVFHSDFVVVKPAMLSDPNFNRPGYVGPPWSGTPEEQWTINGVRKFRSNSSDQVELAWKSGVRAIDDWTAYNMLTPSGLAGNARNVSDVRVAATVVRDTASFSTSLLLHTRRCVFEFALDQQIAALRMRKDDASSEVIAETTAAVSLPPPGRQFHVEFWHVDQAMWLFIDSKQIARLEYDWTPEQRIRRSTGSDRDDIDVQRLIAQEGRPLAIEWQFRGSPFTLHRVQLDRDLHYRFDRLLNGQQKHPPFIHGNAFGTSLIDNVAALGPDHFMMLGDNSSASLDSRLWGRPHPIVATQIDNAPFVVNRKLLLGKAWVVYFPSPLSIGDGGRGFIPDFGRLRFIR